MGLEIWTRISIRVEGGELRVRTPYHPEFVKRARTLGGKFHSSSREWVFDPRVEEYVRGLCREIFGTDGRDRPPLVTVRVRVDLLKPDGNALWLFGRQIAVRWSRDDPVRLGEGVILLQGGFPRSGGSRRYPELEPRPGTVLQVFDVPLPLAEACRGQPWLEILDPEPPPPSGAPQAAPALPGNAGEDAGHRYIPPGDAE